MLIFPVANLELFQSILGVGHPPLSDPGVILVHGRSLL